MLNKIMLPADADAQRARLTSAGAACTGHLAETGSAGAGLVVRMRPWLISDLSMTSVQPKISVQPKTSVQPKISVQPKTSGATTARTAASISFTHARNALITAQPSTAAASGLCAHKQDQEKARSTAAIGGALGSLPPRDPV
jgi:hypothetical protein